MKKYQRPSRAEKLVDTKEEIRGLSFSWYHQGSIY